MLKLRKKLAGVIYVDIMESNKGGTRGWRLAVPSYLEVEVKNVYITRSVNTN